MQTSLQMFSAAQWSQLNALLGTLNVKQKLWLSGYLAERCASAGIPAEVADLAGLRLRRLGKLEHLVVITATHGDGDPPEPILPFYEAIMAEDAARLAGLKFAVLALGDSSYEHFCVTGIELDQRLEALGGERLVPRQDCDVDFARPAAEWMEQLLPRLPRTETEAITASVATQDTTEESSLYSKTNPLEAEVLANQNLSHASRQQPIHHLELALDADNFPVLPGDAVGILAGNPPALVAMLLDATGLSGEQPVTLGQQALSLVEAMRRHCDLCIPGKAFLELWAELTNDTTLASVLNGDNKLLRQFLRQHQIRDLISQFPAHPDAQALVDVLRPLQPRLYDVANSLSELPDELHLTVKAYDYAFGNREEAGIASHYLLGLQPGDSVQLYPHRNARFRLPEQSGTPVILIGEGTGIAPYRAFWQELALSGQQTPCWLVFGEQSFEQDFLYQLDIQQAHAAGVLSHVDTLFHEQQPEATLATPLLVQGSRLLDWLARGAHDPGPAGGPHHQLCCTANLRHGHGRSRALHPTPAVGVRNPENPLRYCRTAHHPAHHWLSQRLRPSLSGRNCPDWPRARTVQPVSGWQLSRRPVGQTIRQQRR